MIVAEWRDFLCQKCAHKFRDQIINGATVNVWVAHLKTIRCPQCGARWNKLSFISPPLVERAGAE